MDTLFMPLANALGASVDQIKVRLSLAAFMSSQLTTSSYSWFPQNQQLA